MKAATLAIASVFLAGAAFADSHMPAAQKSGVVNDANMKNLIRTRDITGGAIYSIGVKYREDDWRGTPYYNAIDTEWKEIGEIEDIVLSRNGQMTGIIAEVGGVLDIGDSHVLLRLDDVKLVAIDDGSYAYVTRKSEEELEKLPQVDEGWWN